MFTGIIEELGKVVDIKRTSYGIILSIEGKKVIENTKIGDSISVNGVCLTAVKITDNVLSFDVMAETLKRTSIGKIKPQEKVNLERALAFGERISGHFVLGHIDGTGIIKSKKNIGGFFEIEILAPQNLSKYIVEKGSIAVDGISLTVAKCNLSKFSIFVIPHTFKNTTLGIKTTGDIVNIEVDIIGKYIEKMIRR